MMDTCSTYMGLTLWCLSLTSSRDSIETEYGIVYEKPISPSGRKLWAECPRKWHDNYILGNRRPSGSAADRGTYLHELLEAYFRGEAAYPCGNRALATWQPFMQGLAAFNPRAEGEVAIDKNWQRVAFDDPEAYFRGKMDLDIEAGSTLLIFDWKSGKEYDSHVDQGKDYCSLSSGYDRYLVNFVYLDQPHYVQRWEYSAEDVAAHNDYLIEVIEEIRNATEFPATPGSGCQYCHLSWRNGGDCKRAP